VAQADAAVASLVSGRRELLHHHGGVGIDWGKRPPALLHCRGRDAAQQNATAGGDLDILRQLRELYFIWKEILATIKISQNVKNCK